MGKRRLNNWRWWLQTCSLGPLVLTTFAPLSATLQEILKPVALAGMLVYLSVESPAFRRLISRFLVPLVAWMLLAPLLSIDPRWVFYGWLGVFAGACLWGVFKREHAEYLAQRERLQ